MELILYNFLVNPSMLTFTSMYIAHYVFDKVIVFNEIFAISQQYKTI